MEKENSMQLVTNSLLCLLMLVSFYSVFLLPLTPQQLAPPQLLPMKHKRDGGFVSWPRKRETIPNFKEGSQIIGHLARYSPEWRIEITEQGLKLESALLKQLGLPVDQPVIRETAGIVKIHLERGLVKPGDKVYVYSRVAARDIQTVTKQLAKGEKPDASIFLPSYHYTKIAEDFQFRVASTQKPQRRFTYLILADEYVNIGGSIGVLSRHWVWKLIGPFSILVPARNSQEALEEIKKLKGKVDLVIPDWDWANTYGELKEGLGQNDTSEFIGILAESCGDDKALVQSVVKWLSSLREGGELPQELNILLDRLEQLRKQELLSTVL